MQGVSMTHAERWAAIDAAIAKFPKRFGLKSLPGRRFSFWRPKSYVRGGKVYLTVFDDVGPICEGSVKALKKEVVL